MRFYNLAEEKTKVDKKSFLDAVNSGREIGITIDGQIVATKDGALPKDAYIFIGRPKSLTGNAVTKPTPLSKILGENYEVEDEGDKITISAAKAWQETLLANAPHSLYQDIGGEGITEFSDKELDKLIWYSCEFGIEYRDVAEYLEERIEGTIIFIENKVPYQFNGCAITDDLQNARSIAYTYIRDKIAGKIEDGTIDIDDPSDDEAEALDFFKLGR